MYTFHVGNYGSREYSAEERANPVNGQKLPHGKSRLNYNNDAWLMPGGFERGIQIGIEITPLFPLLRRG